MANDSSVIQQGSKVSLNFALCLENGDVVDSNFGKEPASLVIGDGTLLTGIEKYLLGLAAGEQKELNIQPEDAFGQPNPANVQEFKRGDFAGMMLEVGLVVSFADASQGELPGVVKELSDELVVVDFNHPLAGKNLLFKVAIASVDAP